MKQGKGSAITLFVFGGIFLAAAIAVLVLTGGDRTFLILGAVIGVMALMFVMLGLAQLMKYKRAKKSISTEGTLANKTYGKAIEYKHFTFSFNKNAEKAANIAVNTLGVLGVLFGGAGTFVIGSNNNVNDLFVNDDEIIINNQRTNGNLKDKKFIVIPKSQIDALNITSSKNFERVMLTYGPEHREIVMDISSKNFDKEAIEKAFNGLMNKTEIQG